MESVKRFERTTSSPEETFAFGVALGLVLQARDYVGLEGQLGAGKTLFARGVAQGAAVPLDEVTSPSYSIVQTYQGRLLLHHADLYRLRSEDELYATGYFDLLESDGAWLVEWVGQVPGAAPADALWLTMELVAANERRLVGRAMGLRSASLMDRWLQCEVDCNSSPRGL